MITITDLILYAVYYGCVFEHIAPLICIGALLEETPNKTASLNSLMDDVNLLIDKKYTQYKELFETEE